MEQSTPTVVNQPTTFTLPLSPPTPQQKYQPPPAPAPRPFGTPLNGTIAYQHEDPRTRLEDALKRSVTVVFWYKPDSPPIRLHGEVATFPLFQLSQFAHLAADLGFSPAAYVDAYNPHARAWEQQSISAVRAVESEQRLLFRMRKSLLEGLEDSECPSLAEEIRLQPQPPEKPHASKKRPSPDGSVLMAPPVKYARVESTLTPPEPNGTSITPSTSADRTPVSLSIPAPFVSVDPSGPGPSKQSPELEGSSTQLTFQTHPLVKRWPNDYTVFELSAGFRQMDLLVAQQPSLTQRTAFERVFSCRYVKSTVCRHRGVWRRAPKELRETFERMAQDERGLWSEFIKRIEGGTGRTDTVGRKKQLAATAEAGTDGEAPLMLTQQPTQFGAVGEDEHRPVMDSLCLPPEEDVPGQHSSSNVTLPHSLNNGDFGGNVNHSGLVGNIS
ncbi:uncharacterized protein C8Q71DRAFT_852077 [Rhodofomes roseus]|uniref:Uncharacterized protein n=1 Tax=Rhodofomes roseus TaxID=34475 RepID=A0ABQ8KW56_9APHY|nr:uncharacterized protein C8Q71DRAFT_852077 [Rhodofomes roseus]KAH9843542.1 hypothetical protein C8Q71DRAFT_852077 [Rhodofomes roseus]